MLAPEAGLLSEREAAIGQIERNRIITKFFLKKRPEKRMLAVRRETMMVVWFKVQGSRNEFEGAVDIREIKEVRKTKNSREFDRHLASTTPDAIKKTDCLFVIYYGSDFNLKTLSAMAISENECNMWLTGLKYLMEDVRSASYKLHQERWFRKGYYEIELGANKENSMIGLPELKKFLSKANCKVANNTLKDKFTKYDKCKTGEIGFDDFCSILQELLLGNRNLFKETFVSYCKDGKRVSLTEFTEFLQQEQNEQVDQFQTAKMVRDFLQDPTRETLEPYFTLSEFLDWLFSKENELFDAEVHSKVNQDMTKPLSHYW